MSEWKKVKFCSLFAIPSKNGLTKPSRVRGKGNKMINMGELFANGRIYDIPMDLVPLNESEKCKNQVLPDDLLFARQSLVLEGAGKCSIVMQTSEMTVFESHLIRIRLNKEDAYPLFYYYYFNSPYNPVKTIVSQCAQAGIRATDLSELQVIHPSLHTQHYIATILSRYDTLIENYQKQIKLLEEAAQRLYKEWFVDLRFPGHENVKMVDGLPEGWERKKVGEVVTKSIGGGWGKDTHQEQYDREGFVIRGTDISKLKNGSLNEIPFRYHTESNLKERTLSDGDIIFEVSGGSEKEPVGRMYLITQPILDYYCKDVICASFCKKVSFANKMISVLCYFAMQHCRNTGDMKKFEKDSAGNIINFAWTTFLEDFNVLLPNNEVLNAFYRRANAIINSEVKLSLQIRLLTEARDRLLPRLMGEGMEILSENEVNTLSS